MSKDAAKNFANCWHNLGSEASDSLQEDIKREPRLALDGGEDDLDFYRRILKDAPNFLVDGGVLAVEVGINRAAAVKTLFERANLTNTEIVKDLSGIERVIAGRKSS